MSVSDKVKFKTFRIGGFNLSTITQQEQQAIANAIVDFSAKPIWTLEDNLRFSLTKAFIFSNLYVAGYLSQQHRLRRHLYDDLKQETKDETDSYEDRLFVIDFNQNLLVLEWRQFRNKPPLTLRLTVQRMADILSQILTSMDIPVRISLEEIFQTTPKQEFLRIFYTYRILEITVDRFGHERVPENVSLVNPNVHLEGAIRELIYHDMPHLGRFSGQAPDEPSANLNCAILARSAVHSGDPTYIRYETPDRLIRVRRKTEKGEIEVSIPDSISDLNSLVTKLIQVLSSVDFDPVVEPPPKPQQLTPVTANFPFPDKKVTMRCRVIPARCSGGMVGN